MKILIWSEAGSHTGYGTVIQNLTERWEINNPDIHILAMNYHGDPWNGPFKLYPATKNNPQDLCGYSRLKEMIEKVKPDLMFILSDLYIITEGLKVFGGSFPVPTVLYIPIDGINVPKTWFEPIRNSAKTVAMSYYGKDIIKKESGLEVDVLWHGIEHGLVYKITEKRPIKVIRDGRIILLKSKEDCKEFLGLKDKFVIFSINRNTIRKNYPDTIKVFDRFRRKHEDAVLLLHTVKNDQGGDLGCLLERYKLNDNNVILHDPKSAVEGSPKELLTIMYNAADIKFSLSMAEGFGLTDAEALACGTPVVAQDFSATTEVVGGGGILVPVERYFTTANSIDFALPNLDRAYEALEMLYSNRELRTRLSNEALNHAIKFNWNYTAEKFYSIFEEIIETKE